MYKVMIQETWKQDPDPTGQRRRSVQFNLTTELPFVPVIGFHWENERLGINLPVNNLSWNGDLGTFVVKHSVSMASKAEIDNHISRAKVLGWDVFEK
jgi:hypothetical protein